MESRGLHPDRANQNQRTESMLAFLLSLLKMRISENLLRTSKNELIDD
jgi:hypothetical protein